LATSFGFWNMILGLIILLLLCRLFADCATALAKQKQARISRMHTNQKLKYGSRSSC
jgi:hypothetical protein